MPELSAHGSRRKELKAQFLLEDKSASESAKTSGIDHVVLICSDLAATIRFYTEVLGMRLTRIAANRDDPTSTHIIFDMGGGNQLAFFDFPESGLTPTLSGIGSLQHLAIKAQPEQFREILACLRRQEVPFWRHGSEEAGAVYLRDPDGILLEITTGYKDPL